MQKCLVVAQRLTIPTHRAVGLQNRFFAKFTEKISAVTGPDPFDLCALGDRD